MIIHNVTNTIKKEGIHMNKPAPTYADFNGQIYREMKINTNGGASYMLNEGLVNIEIDNFVEENVHYINAIIETPNGAVVISDDSKEPYDFIITPVLFANPFYEEEKSFIKNVCNICDKLGIFYIPILNEN